MSDRIYLHPKYGLNPTVPVCAYCGQDKGEVALLGRAYKGEAPHRMVLNAWDPCQACMEKQALGITFVEVVQQDGQDIPGSWCVMNPDAEFLRHIEPESLREQILRTRRAKVTPADWDAMGFPRESFDHTQEETA